jgi:hypothetical protein
MSMPGIQKQVRRSILLCALLFAAASCGNSDEPVETPQKDWRKDFQGTDDVPTKRHVNHPHAKKAHH